jgi:hypothetical protein
LDDVDLSAVHGDPTAISTARSGAVEMQMFNKSPAKEERRREAAE